MNVFKSYLEITSMAKTVDDATDDNATEEQIETIAVVSDIHVGQYKGRERFDPGLWETTVERVNRLEPDLIVFPGDLTASGRREEFERVVGLLQELECQRRVYTRGQKDWDEECPECFAEFFVQLPVYKGFGGLGVFSIDSTDPQRSKMRGEVDETLQMMDCIKPSSPEEYDEHRAYYDSKMNIYLRKMERLRDRLDSDLDFGLVGRLQRKWLTEELKKRWSRLKLKVVMTHYSPVGTSHMDNELVDAYDIKRACVEEGVHLLVAGDRHVSHFEEFSYGGEHNVAVFQAGSVSNIQDDPNQYGVIKIDWGQREVTLCSYYVETGEPATNRFHGNVNYPITFSF